MTDRPRDLLEWIACELVSYLAEQEISPAACKRSIVARRERGRALALRREVRWIANEVQDLDDDATVMAALERHVGCEAGTSLLNWLELERLPALEARDDTRSWMQLQAAGRHGFTPTADGGWTNGQWAIPPEGEPTFGGSPV